VSYSRPSPQFQTNLVAREGYGLGDLRSIGSGIESALMSTARITGAGLDIFAPRTQTVVAAESSVPWIPILAVTGLAIGAIVLMRSRPKANPGKRRRRRR
jgi:hypothetical protein